MPERSERLERLRALIRAYLEEVRAVERKKGPLAGAFGMKGGPADDPCHDRFSEALRAMLEDFAQAKPEPAEARALLEQLLALPPEDCPRSAYWMLLAVQGMAEGLIPALDRENARALLERYGKDYPRRLRLPIQKKMFCRLEKQAR
ncbi:MAG: hypothetical protein ACSW8E_00775 [Clostridia bacterium]